MKIEAHDERLLLKAVSDGDVVLILGAGASAACMTGQGAPVRQGAELARLIAEKAGLQFEEEDELSDVIGAVKGNRLSEQQITAILTSEYTRITPSQELEALFDYTWKRVYTWNIDDALQNVRGGVQRRRFYNGMVDKVATYEGYEFLHIVHLHGEALKPEHGFIFSAAEYNARLNADAHDWYRSAASDYVAHVPIFVGSRLREPIMSAELDRARPSPDAGLGIAFLVTPDKFSEVQRVSLAARNIIVLEATLEGFVGWLQTKVTKKLSPVDVARHGNRFFQELSERVPVSVADVDTAQSIILHTWRGAKADADALQGLARDKAAREYLEGSPPYWRLVAAEIPVWLRRTEDMYSAFLSAVKDRERVFAVYGQSGSGKTTALMQTMLRYLKEGRGDVVYELRSDVRSLKSALGLIHRLHKDEHVVVFVGDAFMFGDSFAEDVLSVPKGSMTLVTSARSNEWREHIHRRVGDVAKSFEYQRFSEADYDPLIGRLLEFVPAPKFKKMSQEDRRRKLRSSKSQLLIALKETTGSDKFTNVITDEFRSLRSDDARALALLVGVATIARTGLSPARARESFGKLRASQNFERALELLEGIVMLSSNGRYVARHELYVRHIIENVAPFPDVVSAIVETLRTYTAYELPVVKNVGRLDGLLFKFLLNHNFNADLAKRRGGLEEALRIYQAFEVDFQLDGHYWLQYGQYLVMMGELEAALRMLYKSIQAYPNNSYAAHAYADVQLRVAAERQNFDSLTVELIGDAVKSLEEQHLRTGWESDQYPLVTLSERHIGALIKHRQMDQARAIAVRYFRQLEEMTRRNSAAPLQQARERLMHFVTFGNWYEGQSIRTLKSGAKQKSRPKKR